MGFFDKLKDSIQKTRQSFTGRIDGLFSGFGGANDAFFDELEETLILADVGVGATEVIVGELKQKVKEQRLGGADEIRALLKEILFSMMEAESGIDFSTKPAMILMTGVNGVGKTTSCAKLAALYKEEGKRVLLCAADTFRAAAADQLEIWSKRAGVDLVRQGEGSDPASVVFDAISAAKARGADLIVCDTAGRLHNKKNLMDELNKIYRVSKRELPSVNIETLLALDATTGQNALIQAKEFAKAASLTGIVLTKLDGTAKGGMVVAVKHELAVPVKFIGVGEQLMDLRRFDAKEFTDALFD